MHTTLASNRNENHNCSNQLTSTEETATSKPLIESQVSALKTLISQLGISYFVSYEKVLPRLMCDKIFTRIPKEDRETCFLNARRQLIEESQNLQRLKSKEAIKSFESLLDELSSRGSIHSTSTRHTLEAKYRNDKRWPSDEETNSSVIDKLIEERVALRKKEKVEEEKNFTTLITEELIRWQKRHSLRDTYSCWDDIKCKFNNHPFYNAIADNNDKFFLFRKALKAVREEWAEGDEQRLNRGLKRYALASKENKSSPEKHNEKPLRKSQELPLNTVPFIKRRKYFKNEQDRGINEASKEQILKRQARQDLKSIFTERIKNPFRMSAQDALKLLEHDVRYIDLKDKLDHSDYVDVFWDFEKTLKQERLNLLEQELFKSEDVKDLSIDFQKACSILNWENDKRFCGLPLEDIEQKFLSWRRNLLEDYKHAFNIFIRSSALVAPNIPDHGPQFRKLLDALSFDERYKRLDAYAPVREQLVINRLKELREGSGGDQLMIERLKERREESGKLGLMDYEFSNDCVEM